MTTKEKAKAYDEALRKIQPLYEQAKKDGNPIWSTYEYLIPKLAESEDERIRKEIIQFFKDASNGKTRVTPSGTFAKWAEFLEKQKELTPIFRVGDTIIAKDGTDIPQEAFHIERIEDGYYWDKEGGSILIGHQDEFQLVEQKPADWSKATINGEPISAENQSVDIPLAEWSEEDETHRAFILESLEDQIRFCKKDAEGAYYAEQIRIAQNWLKSFPERFNLQPKQEWSEEDEKIRKVLLNLVSNDKVAGYTKFYEERGITCDDAIAYLEKQKEQKPAEKLSKEEYVKKFKALCDAYEIKLPNREYDIYHLCEDLHKLFGDIQKPAEWNRQSIIDALTKWLTEKIAPLHKKSVDGTITEKEEMFEAALLEMRSLVNSPDFQIGKDTSAEWSEEDEEARKDAIKLLEAYYTDAIEDYCPHNAETLKKLIDFLKSLSERLNLPPKQEWSDEDEKTIDEAVEYIEKYAEYVQGGFSKQYVLGVARRVDSLRPQPHWKPSAEQMGALNYAYCELFKREDVSHNILGPLQNLIDTLSKL